MLQRLALQRRMPPTTPCKWDSQPRLPRIVSRPVAKHCGFEFETPTDALKANDFTRRMLCPRTSLRHEVHIPTLIVKVRNG